MKGRDCFRTQNPCKEKDPAGQAYLPGINTIFGGDNEQSYFVLFLKALACLYMA